MNARYHRWTPEEEALVRDLYQRESAAEIAARLGRTAQAVFQRANDMGLRKASAWVADRARERSADPAHGGHATRFAPGQTPLNKGIHYQAGGRAAETQFKPGHRRGRAASLWCPVGTLRINCDGYLERKINDDFPIHKRWRYEQILIWEAANGPLPNGHAIVFKDGNKENVDLANLECISRAELLRRNSAHRHGPEIFAIVQLQGAITRQINRRQGKTK